MNVWLVWVFLENMDMWVLHKIFSNEKQASYCRDQLSKGQAYKTQLDKWYVDN